MLVAQLNHHVFLSTFNTCFAGSIVAIPFFLRKKQDVMCILYLYTKTKNELCIPSFCTPKTDTHVKQTISVFYIALFLFLLLFKVNYPPISVVCVSALTERQFNHHQSRWDREYNREELALPDRLLKQEIFPYTVIPVPTSSTYAECQAIVAQSS